MRLHGMPRWVIPVVMGLLLATGLFLSDSWAWLGALMLLAVSAFLAWLLALSWPMLTTGGRLARALVVGAVLGLAALKALGKL